MYFENLIPTTVIDVIPASINHELYEKVVKLMYSGQSLFSFDICTMMRVI